MGPTVVTVFHRSTGRSLTSHGTVVMLYFFEPHGHTTMVSDRFCSRMMAASIRFQSSRWMIWKAWKMG